MKTKNKRINMKDKDKMERRKKECIWMKERKKLHLNNLLILSNST